MDVCKENRKFLKSNFSEFQGIKTDAMKGLPAPVKYKPCPTDGILINLPVVNEDVLVTSNLYTCIKERRSTRLYSESSLSLKELSYLLWSTQGITGQTKSGLTLRTVPCSGATHTFETYLLIRNVMELSAGVYRYLPVEHKLLFLLELDQLESKIDEITLDQPFVPHFANKAAVLFLWSTLPYRSEWKFNITATKKS